MDSDTEMRSPARFDSRVVAPRLEDATMSNVPLVEQCDHHRGRTVVMCFGGITDHLWPPADHRVAARRFGVEEIQSGSVLQETSGSLAN
jgi:hypothetical protein